MTRTTGVAVDCAGAIMGGALRFLQELDRYLACRPEGIRTIGRGRRVTGSWLLEREFRAGGFAHTVALNNLAFVSSGRFKTVLLRNALHFLTDNERDLYPLGRLFRAQASLVHLMVTRADRIIVPTSIMARRVAIAQPRAVDRIRVMPHPVSRSMPYPQRRDHILCPVLNAPYKHLGVRLSEVVDAIDVVRQEASLSNIELLLTLTVPEAIALQLRLPAWVHLLGRLTPDRLCSVQQSARAIVYPTVLESFGYPLAEARLGRQPAIAPYTEHAREVAGDVLVGYFPGDSSSLVSAVKQALALRLDPLLNNPFDPDSYFTELFSAG